MLEIGQWSGGQEKDTRHQVEVGGKVIDKNNRVIGSLVVARHSCTSVASFCRVADCMTLVLLFTERNIEWYFKNTTKLNGNKTTRLHWNECL